MNIMTRVGSEVLDALGENGDFVEGLHSTAQLDEEKRYICHFPQDNAIWSVNSRLRRKRAARAKSALHCE